MKTGLNSNLVRNNYVESLVHQDKLNKFPVAAGAFSGVLLSIGVLFTGGASTQAGAHAFGQRVGFYEDNEFLDRRRLAVDGRWDVKLRPHMMDNQYSLTVSFVRDQDQLREFPDEDIRKYSGNTSERTNDQWGAVASQTWAKLTETRQIFQGSGDGKSSTQTLGVGVSRWVFSESVRLSLDVSRTETEKPDVRILDFDSREVGEPPEGFSRGASLGVRHLATSTSIVDYGIRQSTRRGRPDTQIYSIRLRQYLVRPQRLASMGTLGEILEGSLETPQGSAGFSGSHKPPLSPGSSPSRTISLATMKMSVELALTRAVNKGSIGLETTYGEVDGSTWETYGNVEFPGVLMARVGYRYYREQEVTRVLREEKLFGSDLVSAGISYLFDPSLGPERASFSGNLIVSRYQTNQGLLGRSIELGLSALL